MHSLSRDRRRRLWISALILWAITAGLVSQWPQRSLWYDETVSAYFAERPWSEIWNWCTRIDNQMPLHFALLKLWGSAAGTSEFALRAFSFGCAVLSTAGIMALGRRVGGKASVGWLAALAFVLSQGFLYAAFEVRPYALALALFAWSSVVLWTLWHRYAGASRQSDRRYGCLLAAYLLLALGLIYTHYTGFLALAAQGLYVAWQLLRRRSRQAVLIAAHLAAGLGIGYLPWVVALAGRDVRVGTAYAGRVTPWVALRTYLDFYAYGQRIVPGDAPAYAASIAVLVIGAAVLWMLAYRRKPGQWNGFGLSLLVALVPLTLLLVMDYAVQAKLSGRHAWPAWIGLSLLIGLGLAALDRLRWLKWPVWSAALLVVWLPASAHFAPIYNSYLREAFAYVNQHAEPGDGLVLRDGTLFTAAGYYGARVPWIGLPPDKLTNVNRFLFFDEAINDLEGLVDQHEASRVWVIAWQGQIMDPQNLVAGVLEAIGDLQPLPASYGFGDVSVSLYRRDASPRILYERVAALTPVTQVPPDGPTYYGGYILTGSPIPHGGTVQIHTWWKRGAAVMAGVRVSARLYDPDGKFYAQLDQPPVSASFGQELWPPDSPILSRFTLQVPQEMPSGPAEVRLVLYDIQGTFEPITVSVGGFDVEDRGF
jgi:mannosyltransferase